MRIIFKGVNFEFGLIVIQNVNGSLQSADDLNRQKANLSPQERELYNRQPLTTVALSILDNTTVT